jgi:hypothetical protein
MKAVLEEDYLCYDITSISSYSELNEYIKYGHNRDKEKLPQLNLGVLFGQKGRLPVYYERTPGNITDVSTLHTLLKNFKALEVKSLHYIMDKGFYSKKNVDELVASRSKFLVSVPLNNKWVQHAIDDIHQSIHGPDGYRKLDGEVLYVHSRLHPWEQSNRRCYLHLYYNARARAKAVDQFNEELMGYKQELESENLVSGHQRLEQLKVHGADFVDGVIVANGERYPVRVVDWDEKTERAANIVANSNGISGEFAAEAAQMAIDAAKEFGGLNLDELAAELVVKNESLDPELPDGEIQEKPDMKKLPAFLPTTRKDAWQEITARIEACGGVVIG